MASQDKVDSPDQGLNIQIAKTAGFCFGVKRALDLVEKESNLSDITILGSLIHNPIVIEGLKKRGVSFVDTLDEEISTKKLVITAHGMPSSVKQKAKEQGYEVIDATCPYVEKIHSIVKQLEKENKRICVIGKKDHIEVQGITHDLKEPTIIDCIDDIKDHSHILKDKPLGVVVQTTQEFDKATRIVSELMNITDDLDFYDTICFETKSRQLDAKALAEKSDLMIVIGGLNSSNTKRLAEICERITETKYIEHASELKDEWFTNSKIKNIGITAGASTPDYCIQQVVQKIKEIKGLEEYR